MLSTVLGRISANTSSAHPRTANEAWYWLKRVLCSG